jgi:type IV secretion system protein VirD4
MSATVMLFSSRLTSDSKEGRTVTWTDNLQTMPIITPDEIMRFPQGKCIITNPGYMSGSEGSIPYPVTIPIPKLDVRRITKSEQLWENQVYPRLVERSQLIDASKLDDAIDWRKQIAEQLLTIGEQETNIRNPAKTKSIELVSPSSDPVW